MWFLLLSAATFRVVFKFVEHKGFEARSVLLNLCLVTLVNARIAFVSRVSLRISNVVSFLFEAVLPEHRVGLQEYTPLSNLQRGQQLL